MGYFTYRIFKSISLEQLAAKVKANLAIYDQGTQARKHFVQMFPGINCSALRMEYTTRQDEIFRVLGYQFGCVWMDVRYQDGDWWDVTVMEGPEHRCTHSVNPWTHEENYKYDQKVIDYRINKVCEFWPEFADRLRPYLLPWGMPVRKFGITRFVRRQGKAHESDRRGYGDAEQIYDFVRVFGIDEHHKQIIPAFEIPAGEK
jgi:hypothetical protein